MARRATMLGLALVVSVAALLAACTFTVEDLRAPPDAAAEKSADKPSDAAGDGSADVGVDGGGGP